MYLVPVCASDISTSVKYFVLNILSLALLKEIARVRHRDTLIFSVALSAEPVHTAFDTEYSHDSPTERCITFVTILNYVTYFAHSCNGDGIFFLQWYRRLQF